MGKNEVFGKNRLYGKQIYQRHRICPRDQKMKVRTYDERDQKISR